MLNCVLKQSEMLSCFIEISFYFEMASKFLACDFFASDVTIPTWSEGLILAINKLSRCILTISRNDQEQQLSIDE